MSDKCFRAQVTAVDVVSCPAIRKVKSSSLATGLSNLGERQSLDIVHGPGDGGDRHGAHIPDLYVETYRGILPSLVAAIASRWSILSSAEDTVFWSLRLSEYSFLAFLKCWSKRLSLYFFAVR